MKWGIVFLFVLICLFSCKDIYTEGTAIARVSRVQFIASPPGRSGVPNYFKRVHLTYTIKEKTFNGSFDPKENYNFQVGGYVLIKYAKNPKKFKVVPMTEIEEKVRKKLLKKYEK